MSKLNNSLKTARNEIRNFRRDQNSSYTSALDQSDERVLKEVRENGFSILEGYIDQNTCSQLTEAIDQLIVKYEGQIWVDDTKSDHRIFGANRVSQLINKFYEDKTLTHLTNAYLKKVNQAGFTLAARLEAKSGNLGSGGGWHRDTASKRQIKAIAYLSEVNENNGPFQYLKSSHRSLDVIKKQFKYDLDYRQNRFTNQEIEQMISNKPQSLITFTGKPGTVLIVDTRGIHRGKPIEEGVRYALTNYYLEENIPSKMVDLLIK